MHLLKEIKITILKKYGINWKQFLKTFTIQKVCIQSSTYLDKVIYIYIKTKRIVTTKDNALNL